MALVLVETKDQYNDSISQIPGLKVVLEIVKNIDDFIFEDNMKEKIESRVQIDKYLFRFKWT